VDSNNANERIENGRDVSVDVCANECNVSVLVSVSLSMCEERVAVVKIRRREREKKLF
jgi:hypothetical protein